MSGEVEVKFPRAYADYDDPYRYKVAFGGRGSGKSWTFARKLLLRGVEKKILVLCTRELQKSIKDSVHRLLKNQIDLMGLKEFYEVTGTTIRGLNGTEFLFLGVRHNVDEIKSTEGVDICWIEEGHNLTEESWEIIDPTIRKEGSEIWITFNTRFKFDHLYQLFVANKPPANSLVKQINYDENPYFSEINEQQMLEMKERDYEKYRNIWLGELRTLATGAIFGKQVTEVNKEKRRLFIPIQKSNEVMTFFDLGKNDHTAVWFVQYVGREWRVIDYYDNRLEDIDHYVRVLKAFGYNYGNHYLPHDAAHQRLGMSRSIQEQFEDGGIRPTEIVERIPDKHQAIQMARDIFPSCWFHQGEVGSEDGLIEWLPDGKRTRTERMERGWEVLCNYRYKYNEEDKVFRQIPHHDWASNGADAFMTFAQADKDISSRRADFDKPLDYAEIAIV